MKFSELKKKKKKKKDEKVLYGGTKHITCFWHRFTENISKHRSMRLQRQASMFGNAFCVLYGALIIETFLEII
jgi:hypothetical protein